MRPTVARLASFVAVPLILAVAFFATGAFNASTASAYPRNIAVAGCGCRERLDGHGGRERPG
jgi:hypothetical protein